MNKFKEYLERVQSIKEGTQEGTQEPLTIKFTSNAGETPEQHIKRLEEYLKDKRITEDQVLQIEDKIRSIKSYFKAIDKK